MDVFQLKINFFYLSVKTWEKSLSFCLLNHLDLLLLGGQRWVHPLQRDGGRVPTQPGLIPADQRRLHFWRRPHPRAAASLEALTAPPHGQKRAWWRPARRLGWILWRFEAFVQWRDQSRGGRRRYQGFVCTSEGRLPLPPFAPRYQLARHFLAPSISWTTVRPS